MAKFGVSVPSELQGNARSKPLICPTAFWVKVERSSIGTAKVGSADGVDGVCTKRRILRHTAEVIFCQERSPIMEVTTIGLDL
ncbi:hypothetical protein, partial [Tritonibacter multivorans]|uniref:hypothetical protein n=1 Tax=Tritonibacter multivorans TaxID=928856 RepID=UPI002300452B